MSEEIKETLDWTLEYLEGIDKTRNTKILTTNETNILLDYVNNLQQKVEQLENIRKKAIGYVLKNKLYRFKYDDEELFEITTDKKAKDDLLNILNKGE